MQKLAGLLLALVVSGCNTVPLTPVTEERTQVRSDPRIPVAQFAAEVRAFGGADRTFTIAVVGFDDLSGQRIEEGASTAVASSGKLLVESLLVEPALSGKFSVFSRANLQSLLTERSLAKAFNDNRRQQILEKTPDALRPNVARELQPAFVIPDMRPADLLLYGAVVGYDKSLSDDGAGVGMLGYNAKRQSSADQLYVMVQLIETGSGRIIAVGRGSEAIRSSLTQGGYFGFLSEARILELEAGMALNDPKMAALYVALQQALMEVFGG